MKTLSKEMDTLILHGNKSSLRRRFVDLESSLEIVNMLRRYEFEAYTSTKADEDQKMWTLINMLNMKASKSTPRTIAASTSTMEEDNKWRLKKQVLKPFAKALKNSFPEEKPKLWCNEDGVVYCGEVLSIWPKVKLSRRLNNTRYQGIKGPEDVGMRIKGGLVSQDLRSMIEGVPCVNDVGFVTIKLSGNWMVENIHTMLRDSIDKWAPRQQHDFRRTIVNSPSWDGSNLMPIDVLRRQFIIMSQMHILEYVKSDATTSAGNGMSLTPDKLDEHFRIVEEDGEVLIYAKETLCTKPLIRGKSRMGKSLGERDGCFGYPLEDLGALWHGLVNKKADWIVCVTPSQQGDYVKKCFNAAKDAGWIPTCNIQPKATYIGFKTCSTSLEHLLSFLCKAQYPYEAGEAAKVLGYSDEAVLDCAVTYTFLKYHRLADCKFSYNEMLDIKGDTFVYLLTTLAQIRKITNHSREDIDELKKASKLVLEEDKVVWSQGAERELGFHLLMFTELINEFYLSFLPHLFCRYLYDLSKKFNRFYETYASSGFEEKTRLLLFEATAVVMEKGFYILGITQKPSLRAVSVALALNYVAPLEVWNPPKNPNIRTRFEVFTTYVTERYHGFKDGNLFGLIQVSDYYGRLPPHGSGKKCDRGSRGVGLLSSHWRDSVEMRDNGFLEIGNPSYSVPFSPSMQIGILLYAKNKDDFLKVCSHWSYLNFLPFLDKDSESSCEFVIVGDNIRMNYILLRDAVDATIKVKFGRVSNRRVCGEILAYYDKSYYGDNNLGKRFYKASLFESYDGSILEDGDVPLTRSILAVPIKGSLIIEAHLTDFVSGDVILHGCCTFSSHCEGSFKKDIKCTLEVEITWSQG